MLSKTYRRVSKSWLRSSSPQFTKADFRRHRIEIPPAISPMTSRRPCFARCRGRESASERQFERADYEDRCALALPPPSGSLRAARLEIERMMSARHAVLSQGGKQVPPHFLAWPGTLGRTDSKRCRPHARLMISIFRPPKRRAPFSVTTMGSPKYAVILVPLTPTFNLRSKTMPGWKTASPGP